MQYENQITIAGYEDKGRGPWTRENRWPLEAKKGKKKQILLGGFQKEYSPLDTLILAQWHMCQASDEQNCRLCCLTH